MQETLAKKDLPSFGAPPSASQVPRLVHELFEVQADYRPDAVAIVCGDVQLTYGELEQRANRLARYLRSLGVGRGNIVGLSFDRSELPIVAILACLKAGAAYVPIDPSHPAERIRYIQDEAEVSIVLTEQSVLERAGAAFTGRTIALDKVAAEIAAFSPWRLLPRDTGTQPEDLCYVLYTSGTTGRPKGVMTEHRNACHFVVAFNEVCQTTPEDRIYQGFSLGFDGSVEEIWMAFSNGAALVVGTRDAPRFGNDLARYLAQQRVTYFSTVPTMLSTMTEEVPTLRQLVVSGEVCPPELVARWAKNGRLMLNVYGPTEATVNTTAFVCRRGKPITIGRPLDGYTASILDSEMRPVPHGEKGELYIGGPGLARGYLKRPDLTAQAFVTSPEGTRLYRTGDLARFNEQGEIEFFGRIDGQVKIRGFRVELAEIESVLLEQPGIASASVRLHEGDGVQSLAAYVLLDEATTSLDRGSVLAGLRAKLPAYMVPATLDILDEFPMLASGKVDRKRLPAPVSPLFEESSAQARPATALEESIAKVWAAIFKVPEVGVEQDFFLDLGGHSLLAAKTVAQLRTEAGVNVPVRDIYAYPTVRKLAARAAELSAEKPAAEKAAKQHPAAALPNVARKPGAGMIALQVAYLLLLGPVLALPLVIVMPPFVDMLYFRQPILWVILYLIAVGLALWPIFIALALGSKWLIIGRYKPGVYPLWGSYYMRWWLVSRLQGLSGLGAFGGTPLAPFMFRIMGAKVGKNCMIQTGLVSAWDCISIGDDTSIGSDTQLTGARVENGYLIIGKVEIGNRCYVGSHSALGLDVKMGDDSRLDDQSLLPDGEEIPAGESRRGSPARPAEVVVPEGPPLRRSRTYLTLFCLAQVLTVLVLGLTLGLPAIVLGLGSAFLIVHAPTSVWIPLVAAAVPVLIVFFCFWAAWCKRLIMPNPQPGVYQLYSFRYLQFWLIAGMMRAVRGAGFLIFTTLYLPPVMRMLGARLGKHTEMSTIWGVFPDMLVAGDSVFFADGCIMSANRTYLGRVAIMENRIGDRSFIGNSAMLPAGTGLGNDCLLGVLSAPPESIGTTPDGTDWLGSPGFRLPNRLKVTGFDRSTTYEPTRKLYIQRAMIDSLRILIPAYLATVLGTSAFLIALALYNTYGVWAVFAAAPFMGWTAMAIAVAVTVAIKRAVMGTFKPEIVPLWCRYVWLNEMLNGIYESVMAPVVALFFGTPFAAPLLRLLGCKIGKHCYIGTNLFSEFDLVIIGDYVALNGGVVIQNHLFEDRVMKSSYLTIGDRCSVGNMAVVLYDTRMEEGAVLGPMSLLMKGEVMPAGSRWHGIPTAAT